MPQRLRSAVSKSAKRVLLPSLLSPAPLFLLAIFSQPCYLLPAQTRKKRNSRIMVAHGASANTPYPFARTFAPPPHLPRPIALVGGSRRSEAGEPTGAREHVCGPGVILTASVKGAREGARVKIMPVGCPQTAGRASRSGAGLGHSRRRIGVVGLTRTAEMW